MRPCAALWLALCWSAGCTQPAPSPPPVSPPGARLVILLGVGLPLAEVEGLAVELGAHPLFGVKALAFQSRAVGEIDLGWRADPATPGPYLELDRRRLLQVLDEGGGRGDYVVVLRPGQRGGGTRQDVAVVGWTEPYGRSVLLHELAHLIGGLDDGYEEGYEGEGARAHAVGESCLMAEQAATEFCADCARALRVALDQAAKIR